MNKPTIKQFNDTLDEIRANNKAFRDRQDGRVRIPVKAARSAWFDMDYITVQVLDEDGEVVYCDHAGATEEEQDYGTLRPDSVGDLDWSDDWHNTLVCDKCDWSEMIEPSEPDDRTIGWDD